MEISKDNLNNINLKNNILTKILLILAFIFIILTLVIIARTPPASGYEISIYSAYPWYFWIFLIGANFSATLVLIQGIFNERRTNLIILGFLTILIGNSIFILLSFFRGYCFIGGAGADIFSHIAWITEMSQLGHVTENNFYPIIHIFILSISNSLGVSVITVIPFIPAFFWALYPPFMFLLAKSVSKNSSQALLITAFSLPLIFSIFQLTIHPSFLSFIFLPLLIYLYYKRTYSERKLEWAILILVICFLIIFFHPMTTLISVVIFSIFILSEVRSKKSIMNSPALTIIIIFVISFLVWYTSYEWGLRSIKSIYNHLIYGSEWTIAANYLSTLSAANLTVFQTIGLFVLRYGAIAIYGMTAFFCIIIIGKKLVFSRRMGEMEFSYGLQVVSAFLFAAAMISSDFIITNPVRSARYFLVMVAILNGLVIYSIIEKNKNQKIINNQEPTSSLHVGRHKLYFDKKKWEKKFNKKNFLPLLITALLFFSSGVCMFNVYPSSVTWETNWQFTYMNFAGSAWVTENRDIRIQTSGDNGFNLWRMEHYMNGLKKGDMRMITKSLSTRTHFGYDNINYTLSKVFNYTNTYMITTENGRQAVYSLPKNVQSKATQFNSDDFNKLISDIAVSKIYDNSELEVWSIYGM